MLGVNDDLNLYAYTYNDPLNKADPNGEAAIVPLGIWAYRAYTVWRAARAAAAVAGSSAATSSINAGVTAASGGTPQEVSASAKGGAVEGFLLGPLNALSISAKTARGAAAIQTTGGLGAASAGAATESAASAEPKSGVEVVISTLFGVGGNASKLAPEALRDSLGSASPAAAERAAASAELAADAAIEATEQAVNDKVRPDKQ